MWLKPSNIKSFHIVYSFYKELSYLAKIIQYTYKGTAYRYESEKLQPNCTIPEQDSTNFGFIDTAVDYATHMHLFRAANVIYYTYDNWNSGLWSIIKSPTFIFHTLGFTADVTRPAKYIKHFTNSTEGARTAAYAKTIFADMPELVGIPATKAYGDLLKLALKEKYTKIELCVRAAEGLIIPILHFGTKSFHDSQELHYEHKQIRLCNETTTTGNSPESHEEL